MKTKSHLLWAGLVLGIIHSAWAQPVITHRIGGITANPDRSISLSLAGVVPTPFAAYYDIYPLEASTNLVDLVAVGPAPAHERIIGPIELSRLRRGELR